MFQQQKAQNMFLIFNDIKNLHSNLKIKKTPNLQEFPTKPLNAKNKLVMLQKASVFETGNAAVSPISQMKKLKQGFGLIRARCFENEPSVRVQRQEGPLRFPKAPDKSSNYIHLPFRLYHYVMSDCLREN